MKDYSEKEKSFIAGGNEAEQDIFNAGAYLLELLKK